MEMNLLETSQLMLSADYKDRFKGEYYQLIIRYYKLNQIIQDYEAEQLEEELESPIELLREQLEVMGRYKEILEQRANEEDIDIGLIEVELENPFDELVN